MPFVAIPPVLLTAGIFVLLLAAMFLVWAPVQRAPASRVAEYTRLALPSSPGVVLEGHGVHERLLGPFFERVLEWAASTAPKRIRNQTAADLTMAGSSMTPTTFLGIRGLVMFGLPMLTAALVLSAPERTLVHWAFLGMAIIWARKLPGLWLRRKIKARQRVIDRGLPYALDLMVACLEGGLSLDATLAKVAEQSTGPLSDEIQRTLHEMTLGRPAAEALRDLGDRTGAPDLKRLTENIVQADRMGISITDTMRTLAAESRIRRRQRAEEMARKAPIKMVPVLIFCILPALGAVVMTPAVLIILRVFRDSIP